jgi:hypothetical protein
MNPEVERGEHRVYDRGSSWLGVFGWSCCLYGQLGLKRGLSTSFRLITYKFSEFFIQCNMMYCMTLVLIT